MMMCIHKPYEFHTPEGMIEFFRSCDQALNVLQYSTKNRLNVVPSTSQWHITQFDYNKDIPTTNNNINDTSHPQVIDRSSSSSSSSSSLYSSANGMLKVKHLGTIFQIYPNGLPDLGDCLRFEGQYITKEKKKLKDSISDMIANGVRDYDSNNNKDGENNSERDSKKSPFVTAADLLKEPRE